MRPTNANVKKEAMIIQMIGLFFIQKSINQVQKYNILKNRAKKESKLCFFYKEVRKCCGGANFPMLDAE
jgi:hypothetical protein